MQCQNCGTELLAGKAFCHACGARAPQACSRCGAALDPRFRFCPDCGEPATTVPVPTPPAQAAPEPPLAALPPHVPDDLARKIRATRDAVEGERKIVTVLFCDLVGSTALAEGLDPEEYHELLEQYVELAFREIYRCEGIVNQLAGDGFMALFGAPIAHEDAPQRAVRAALNIRTALDEFNQRLHAERGFDLRARIGIHTGPVVVGTVGNDLKMDYTAIGDTTNLAARLEALAQPGTVLVSEATHRLVRGHFDMTRVGPLAVKGKSEPVTAYEVHAAADTSAPMAVASGHGLTRFVGRDAELAQLEACFARLSDGLSQVVAIVGQAGMGKSRLLYELRQRLGTKPAAILEARCSAWNQMIPYHPWVGMLRHYFGIDPDAPATTACAQVAERLRAFDPPIMDAYTYLCHLLALPVPGAASLAGDDLKRQTFEAVAHLVGAEMGRGPVVMIIEDLQWIDDLSREMLEVAIAEMAVKPMMLVLSHRPDFQPRWRTSAAFTQLTLRRLSEREVAAIVHDLAGAPLPERLEGMVLAKAEGSPFLTEEITRSLLEEGDLVTDNGTVRLTRPIEDVRIPGTVQEVIAARLDRLGPSAKRVVQVAAVFGRQFDREQLAAVLAPEGIDVARELDELEERGVVHRKNLFSNDEYRFGESLTQEVAYEGLLLKQRRQLHERIGALLAATPGEHTAERLAVVAHHYSRSDNRERSAQTLLQSAQAAEQIPAYASAARAYRDAWEIAVDGAEAAPTGTLAPLALAAAVGLCRMTVIYNIPDPGDVGTIIERASALAEQTGDQPVFAGLRAFHGMLLIRSGRDSFQDGLTRIEEGWALARRAGAAATSTGVARALAWSYLLDGRFALARQTIDWFVAELEREGHATTLTDLYLGARWLRDVIGFHSDDFEALKATSTETYELAVRAGNRTVQSSAATGIALQHLLRAEYLEALGLADRAITVAQLIGNQTTTLLAAAVAVIASLESDPTRPVGRYVELLDQCIPEAPDPATNIHLVVEALISVGDVRRAERAAQRAHPRAAGRLRDMHAGLALAHVCFLLGPDRWVEAARWYDEVIHTAEATGARTLLAIAHLGVGELAAVRGDAQAALPHLERAVALARELGLARYGMPAADLLAELTGRTPRETATSAA